MPERSAAWIGRIKWAVVGTLGLGIFWFLPTSIPLSIKTGANAQTDSLLPNLALDNPGSRTSVHLDKRQWADPDPYYIEFSAVQAHGAGLSWKPGHVFVTFNERDSEGLLHSRGSFGMYPSMSLVGAGSLFFGPLPGGLKDELYQKSLKKASLRLIVRVDRGQFERAWLVQKDWAKTDVYRLVTHDCVTFMSDVAAVIGLTAPPRIRHILPFDFVEELIKLNKPDKPYSAKPDILQ